MANASTSSGQPLTLLQAVRAAIRRKHYSYRTEKCYLFWVRQFLRYHGRRHPRQMGAAEVTAQKATSLPLGLRPPGHGDHESPLKGRRHLIDTQHDLHFSGLKRAAIAPR
jgi:Phage integrase, N-terminal SAM-like domain